VSALATAGRPQAVDLRRTGPSAYAGGVPHPVRTIAFGALALGALAACTADSAGTSTLPPMVPSTTAFATLPPVTAPPTTQPGETTTIPPGAPIEYIVKSGDYLFGIASAHGVTADDIVTLNGWEDGIEHPLNPGDTIIVPAAAAGTATTTAPPTATATPGNTATTTAPPTGGDASTTTVAPGGEPTTSSTSAVPEGGQEYTVKNNDTVYGIARKFGITPQALVAANGWSDVNHALYPGDTIIVPAAG
jgi:LysM repeat protein